MSINNSPDCILRTYYCRGIVNITFSTSHILKTCRPIRLGCIRLFKITHKKYYVTLELTKTLSYLMYGCIWFLNHLLYDYILYNSLSSFICFSTCRLFSFLFPYSYPVSFYLFYASSNLSVNFLDIFLTGTYAGDRILLESLKVITLHQGRLTNGRRSAPVPQVSISITFWTFFNHFVIFCLISTATMCRRVCWLLRIRASSCAMQKHGLWWLWCPVGM